MDRQQPAHDLLLGHFNGLDSRFTVGQPVALLRWGSIVEFGTVTRVDPSILGTHNATVAWNAPTSVRLGSDVLVGAKAVSDASLLGTDASLGIATILGIPPATEVVA